MIKNICNAIATMTKREQTKDLYREVLEEMETDWLRHKQYGKAIAIVRTVYQVPVNGITGIKAEDVRDIESGSSTKRRSISLCRCFGAGVR